MKGDLVESLFTDAKATETNNSSMSLVQITAKIEADKQASQLFRKLDTVHKLGSKLSLKERIVDYLSIGEKSIEQLGDIFIQVLETEQDIKEFSRVLK